MVEWIERFIHLGYTYKQAVSIKERSLRKANYDFNKALFLIEQEYTKVLLGSNANKKRHKASSMDFVDNNRKPRKPRKPRKKRVRN